MEDKLCSSTPQRTLPNTAQRLRDAHLKALLANGIRRRSMVHHFAKAETRRCRSCYVTRKNDRYNPSLGGSSWERQLIRTLLGVGLEMRRHHITGPPSVSGDINGQRLGGSGRLRGESSLN